MGAVIAICFIGMVIFFICLPFIVTHKSDVERQTKANEDRLNFRKYKAMSQKREEYLPEFKGEPDYYMLEVLFDKLPHYYNCYASATLNTPPALSRPISPYTAGLIGTAVGGTAVGIVAAMSAAEKEQKYKEIAQLVISRNIERGNACDKVHNCFLSIEAIINSKEKTRLDWEATCRTL